MDSKSFVIDARSWAFSLWAEAANRWSGREGQDRNYRMHVVHPALRSVLLERIPSRGLHILDLGCGDGSFLDDMENKKLIADGGSYFGVDASCELVDAAFARHRKANIRFLMCDINDLETEIRIVHLRTKWDATLAVFVLQEMPDIESFFHLIGRVVPPGGLAIAITVHPSFGDWLRETGRMETADEFAREGAAAPELWRWAGFYPIVDEPREPFYLPYFHRTVDDYRMAFQRAGFSVLNICEIPDSGDRIMLKEKGISPFIPFETNRYWPRIAEEPSALLIVAVKEAGA